MDYDGVDFPRTKEIYDIPTLVNLIRHSIDLYYTIGDDNLIEDYQPVYIDEQTKEVYPV